MKDASAAHAPPPRTQPLFDIDWDDPYDVLAAGVAIASVAAAVLYGLSRWISG